MLCGPETCWPGCWLTLSGRHDLPEINSSCDSRVALELGMAERAVTFARTCWTKAHLLNRWNDERGMS